MDGAKRLAMVETKTISGGAAVTPLVSMFRYQLGNHLGSAVLEVDAAGLIISYEEVTPYGSSAYRSSRSGVDVSARRYRYVGLERDSETGLDSMGARYYAAWLGRWTSADPMGIGADGPGVYNYTRGSPVVLTDPGGMQATDDRTGGGQGAGSGPDNQALAEAAERRKQDEAAARGQDIVRNMIAHEEALAGKSIFKKVTETTSYGDGYFYVLDEEALAGRDEGQVEQLRQGLRDFQSLVPKGRDAPRPHMTQVAGRSFGETIIGTDEEVGAEVEARGQKDSDERRDRYVEAVTQKLGGARPRGHARPVTRGRGSPSVPRSLAETSGLPNNAPRPNARGAREKIIRYGSEAEADSTKVAAGLVPRAGHRGPKRIATEGAQIDPRKLGEAKQYSHRMEFEVVKGTTDYLKRSGWDIEGEPGRYAIPEALVSAFNKLIKGVTVIPIRKTR